ncbi:hypothetical protein RF11_01951 [Thelohanellus kitauei]|uniref:Uncharacterized protein n=1 Tax=Thelohanellus kitauei TaxID=669202 RepID=A0A0C2MUU6_THEKT|nr:hypothetical protein RF11_01951 [Thelohanellus kitauei]
MTVNHENQYRFVELEDDNEFLNLHIELRKGGSTACIGANQVLPGRSDIGFLTSLPPNTGDARKDCAVVFYENRFSILKFTTTDSPTGSLSASFQLTMRIHAAKRGSRFYMAPQNIDMYGWKFTCPLHYTYSNELKTTFVADDTWTNMKIEFTVSDVFGPFQATSTWFFTNNILLESSSLSQFRLRNIRFMRFSSPTVGNMHESNWIPLGADTEKVTTCRRDGYNGEIIEILFQNKLVDRRSSVRTKKGTYTGLSLKRRFTSCQLDQCKSSCTIVTRPVN